MPAGTGAVPFHFEWSLISVIHARMVALIGSLFLCRAVAMRAPSASNPGKLVPENQSKKLRTIFLDRACLCRCVAGDFPRQSVSLSSDVAGLLYPSPAEN